MDGLDVFQAVSSFLGTLPPAYTWIIGGCVVILFTFVSSFIFDFVVSFFGLLRIGGSDRRG